MLTLSGGDSVDRDTAILVAVVVAALFLGAGTAWLIGRRRRSKHLRARFGPEYEHAVEHAESRREAERELESREARVERIQLRDLSSDDRAGFAESWRLVQGRFVDDPVLAIREADALLTRVMSARGYPMGDFEQRAGDISVDRPQLVQDYRAAHDIAMRSGKGEATTEDRREAMIHYRALFVDLLETSPSEVEEARQRRG